jgi:lipopolysaccharide assembly outer membrane protein LptD (OstA)
VTAVMGTATKTEKPMAVSLGLTLSQRQYTKRPTQDAVGAYGSSKIHQLNTAVSATVSYPMDPNFSLVGNLQYGRADSNMGFQQFYKYDYSSLNYLFGVSWEY